MSLTGVQWIRLIFIDVPEAKADLTTLSTIAFIKKWAPRLSVYGEVLGQTPVSPHEVVKRIAARHLTTSEQALMDRASRPNGGGG